MCASKRPLRLCLVTPRNLEDRVAALPRSPPLLLPPPPAKGKSGTTRAVGRLALQRPLGQLLPQKASLNPLQRRRWVDPTTSSLNAGLEAQGLHICRLLQGFVHPTLKLGSQLLYSLCQFPDGSQVRGWTQWTQLRVASHYRTMSSPGMHDPSSDTNLYQRSTKISQETKTSNHPCPLIPLPRWYHEEKASSNGNVSLIPPYMMMTMT